MTDQKNQSTSYSTAKLTGLGTEVIASILTGGLLGYLIDRWQGTKPTGLAVGMIAGLIIGMVVLTRKALRASRAATADYMAKHPKPEQTPEMKDKSDD